MIASGNDASVVMAEHIAGSEEESRQEDESEGGGTGTERYTL